MIGGRIIEVIYVDASIRLWCVDRNGDESTVHIAMTADVPAVGDDVWWQSDKVYWTPTDRRFVDKPLCKIGYSVGI